MLMILSEKHNEQLDDISNHSVVEITVKIGQKLIYSL